MPLPERQLIARIRRKAHARRTVLGIGDDCAILRIPAGEEALVTTDFSLEGIHFRHDWQSPECIGHRCLARGLSDIAAMGGTPIAAFLSLAIPRGISQSWIDRFFKGLLRLARRHRVDLAGGDTAQSSAGLLADITVLGSIKKGRALRRSGARVGDQIYLTGELGESAAALKLLSTGEIKKRDVFPEPRIAVGQWLVQNRIASACIDISDGLSTDLSHICEESGVGAVIDGNTIPVHEAASNRKGDLTLALHGGDDYELLFTAPGGKVVPVQIAGVHVTRIGQMIRENRVSLVQNSKRRPLAPKGWQHFSEA